MATSVRPARSGSTWSVQLPGGTFVGELRPLSARVWEVLLFRDGWLIFNRRFVRYGEATEFSAVLRSNFERISPADTMAVGAPDPFGSEALKADMNRRRS